MAARIIGVHSQLSLGRQIFFCNLGGFDTHSGQLNAYTGQTPLLQAEELRAWLMTLAVDAARISLLNDVKPNEALKIEVVK